MRYSTATHCMLGLFLLFGCGDAHILDPVYAQIEQFEYPPAIYYQEAEFWALSKEERHAVLQIPDHLLPHLSTTTLVQAYLDFPFVGHMTLYSTMKRGFEVEVVNDFNGLRELLARKDAFEKALNYYEGMDPGDYDPEWEPLKQGLYAFRFVCMEILLAQEALLNNLDKSMIQYLFSVLLDKTEEKQKHPMYGSWRFYATVPIAQVIQLYQDVYPEFQQTVQNNPMVNILTASLSSSTGNLIEALLMSAQQFASQ